MDKQIQKAVEAAITKAGLVSAPLDSKIYALERRAQKVVDILPSIPSSKEK